MSQVENQLLAYIKRFVPEAGLAVLAGNSVHADKVFLSKDMPKIIDHLHYRIVDVSTIKELQRRWRKDLKFIKESNHRALSDIQDSIEELRYYRKKWLT